LRVGLFGCGVARHLDVEVGAHLEELAELRVALGKEEVGGAVADQRDTQRGWNRLRALRRADRPLRLTATFQRDCLEA